MKKVFIIEEEQKIRILYSERLIEYGLEARDAASNRLIFIECLLSKKEFNDDASKI